MCTLKIADGPHPTGALAEALLVPPVVVPPAAVLPPAPPSLPLLPPVPVPVPVTVPPPELLLELPELLPRPPGKITALYTASILTLLLDDDDEAAVVD